MATYTDENVTVSAVGVYSDSGCTVLVEDLTGSLTNPGTGLYEIGTALNYNLYSLGVLYYLKITYTPSGDTARSQVFPFYVFPQSQALAASAITEADCEDGSYLQPPDLALRIGRDAYREEDLENFIEHAVFRHEAVFRLPDYRYAFELHILLENSRAGAPFAPALISMHGNEGDNRLGSGEEEKIVNLAVERGYRASSLGQQSLMRLSRNLDISDDVPRRRRGYRVVDAVSAISSGVESIRIPVSRADGTVKFVFLAGTAIYEDDLSTSLVTGLTNAYAAAATWPHRWMAYRGRAILLGHSDSDRRILIHDGSNYLARASAATPTTPTIAANSSGHSLAVGTWYARVRYYDSKTGTFSCESAVVSVSVTATGERIQITPNSIAARWTHWQVQLVLGTDTPPGYEIHYVPRDTGGTPIAGVTTGLIPVATTTVYFTEAPASGDRFPFRYTGAAYYYRTATPPAGGYHVCSYQGRAIYAPKDDTWVVIGEPDNLEHGYWDPVNPAAGLSSFSGVEGLVDSVTSPIMALAATELAFFVFMRHGVVMGTGSLQEQFASDGYTLLGRDVNFDVISQNSHGAISPSVQVVDNDVYFYSDSGPTAIVNGGFFPLDTMAIRAEWRCRDPLYERRYHIGYDPYRRLVLFSFVTKNAPIAGVPDVTLAWSLDRREWCAPWDFCCSSWTLHRYNDGNDRNTRVFAGGPYGAMLEYGHGNGDGEDGSDADAADLLATTSGTTSAVVSGKAWTTDEWKHKSVVLIDRATGRRHTRWVLSNTGDTINWEGSATHSGSGWKLNLGGIHGRYHTSYFSPGRPFVLKHFRVQVQDLLSVYA